MHAARRSASLEPIHPDTLEALKRYVIDLIPTGDFLRAVLENNLQESFGRADYDNRMAMFDVVCAVYNDLPADCHGSPEKVAQWLSQDDEL